MGFLPVRGRSQLQSKSHLQALMMFPSLMMKMVNLSSEESYSYYRYGDWYYIYSNSD